MAVSSDSEGFTRSLKSVISNSSGFYGSGIQVNRQLLDYQGFQVWQPASFQGKPLPLASWLILLDPALNLEVSPRKNDSCGRGYGLIKHFYR